MADGWRMSFLVFIDLDTAPGTMHTEESAREVLVNILDNAIPHYNPKVFVTTAFIESNANKE